jgi:regulator of sirC expression with transglutaminase-like and TPR domain
LGGPIVASVDERLVTMVGDTKWLHGATWLRPATATDQCSPEGELMESWFVPSQFPDSPEFQRLVSGADEVHLARIALEIARDAHPDLDIERYLGKIDELAERARGRCRPGSKVRDIVGQINWVLFVEAGLRANEEDYYDPRNSYLNEVLDRGLGIPITLSVVYWAVAERMGLTLGGANLPVHFMLRFEEDGLTWFIDPFQAGAIYTVENCQRRLSELVQQPVLMSDSQAAPCSIRQVVVRMLRNLKAIYGNLQDITSLMPVQRRLAAISQDDPKELRDLGLLCAQTNRLGAALDPLRAYLESVPLAEDVKEIRALIEAICRQIARWN